MADKQYPTVLWIDDDSAFLYDYLDKLRNCDFNVRVATSIAEAEGELRRHDFDLLLVEWRLGPDNTADQFIDRLAFVQPNAPIVVILSSYLDDEIRAKLSRKSLRLYLFEKSALPLPPDDFRDSHFVRTLHDLLKQPRLKASLRRRTITAGLLPLFRLRFEGRDGPELTAALDTGSQLSLISHEWLLRHNLIDPKARKHMALLAGEKRMAINARHPCVLIQDDRLLEVDLRFQAIIDWEDSFFRETPPDVHGIVGRDFLEDNKFTVTVSEGQSTISKREAGVNRNRKSTARSKRTTIRKNITANLAEIIISAQAMLVLLNERIHALGAERPNSFEAQERRRSQIEDYGALRSLVQDFNDSVVGFHTGKVSEREAEKATLSFADGVKLWWTRRHEVICQRALDLGLFLTAVSICSLAGAGGPLAVAVSGALVGGKTVVDAVKALGRTKIDK